MAGVMVLAMLGRMPKLRTVLPFAWNASGSNPRSKGLALECIETVDSFRFLGLTFGLLPVNRVCRWQLKKANVHVRSVELSE